MAQHTVTLIKPERVLIHKVTERSGKQETMQEGPALTFPESTGTFIKQNENST
jgi:hypothetical protein